MLTLTGVAKGFPEGERWRQVLHGLDLEVRCGEFLCITGRSGSGKSTLLNVLGGIEPPDRGQVVFDGVDLGKLSDRQRTLHRRRHIGFVFQFFNLVPGLTVEENLRLPLDLNRQPHEGVALDWLARLGLEDRAGAWPEVLSGGEQQRVAIARALVHSPSLLLADEPTGNLDADNAERVMQALIDLCRVQHTTLVVVTHARDMTRAADRTLVLREGRLHET